MNDVDKNEEKPRAQAKRPYETPVLREYGDIRQVTQHGNPKGNADGLPGQAS
jgi:hypothetical protein